MKEILKDNKRINIVRENDVVIKRFKNLTPEQNKMLLGKLERKDELKGIKGFVVPFDYQVKNGKVEEIYTQYVKLPDFFRPDLAPKDFTLEVISKCFDNLNKTLKQAHEKDVVFLDFTSDGNVKYNPKTFETYIMDFEDCQIGNNISFACSMHLVNTPVCNFPKYRNGMQFTKNADIFLLVLRWFNMCTQVQLNYDFMSPEEMLMMMNMNDPEIVRKVILCFSQFGNNEYFDGDFMRIFKEYKMEEYSYDIGRAFVKR